MIFVDRQKDNRQIARQYSDNTPGINYDQYPAKNTQYLLFINIVNNTAKESTDILLITVKQLSLFKTKQEQKNFERKYTETQ